MQVALRRALLILGLLVATAALAQVPPPSKNLAPGFAGMRVGDKLLLMPIDVELF